jgi:hypothetical protein
MTPDELTDLPEPKPPAGLAAVVMARTARLADECRDSSSGTAAVALTGHRGPTGAWPMVGLALGLVSVVYALIATGAPLDVASPRIGGALNSLVAMPPTGSTAVALAAGLLFYLTGLFAPLRDSGTPGSR